MTSEAKDSKIYIETNYISEDSLDPRHALIFYTERYKRDTEIELITFADSFGTIESRKFITDADAHLLQKYFGSNEHIDVGGFRGLIPKNVLFFDKNAENIRCAWISKPPTHFYFNGKKTLLECPDLYFYSDLFTTRAFHINKFTRETTRLYYTAFGNSTSTDVCWGSVKVEKKVQYAEDYIKRIELAFWNSSFTHIANYTKVWKGRKLVITKAMLKPVKIKKNKKLSITKTIADDII